MNTNLSRLMLTISIPKNIKQCICVNYSMVPNNNLSEIVISNKRNVLENTSENLSEITPYFPKAYNFAAYINNSTTLQNLLHLNVNLDKIEKKPYVAEKLLKLDFEKDMKQRIFFLKDFVDINQIGDYITKNPLILCEYIEDLKIRINYLESKHFSNDQIKQIISKNPFWLMFSTLRIDKRLGFYQNKFNLSGYEVRSLAAKQPKLITYNMHHINTNIFVIKEEMGFEDSEIKTLILNRPKIFMLNQKSLLERFNYLHNTMKIPHNIILKYPNTLLCRNFKVKQRHVFLKQLGRAQYDPTKENYIPIMALVEDSDVHFVKNYAKCNIDEFNSFLKTQ